MPGAVSLLTFLVFGALICSAEVCPKAAVEQSGAVPDLSWASGVQSMGKEKSCTQFQVTSRNPDGPMSVVWPAAGILDAKIGGRFVSSVCCSEDIKIQKVVLQYGQMASKTLDTLVHVGSSGEIDDYPDLIEPDARIKQTSFTGSVWDGSRYITINLELRASASHPHYSQSVFEFVIADHSSEPLIVEWDLLEKMNRTMKSFFTESPRGSQYRQSTSVFFATDRPSPQGGVVAVKTAAGRFLGRFVADGFTNETVGKR